jgi:hypothetical protein
MGVREEERYLAWSDANVEFIVPETMRTVTCSDGEAGRSDVESLKEFYRELESVSSFGEL